MPDSQINAKYVKGEVRIVTEQARYLRGLRAVVAKYKDLPPNLIERHVALSFQLTIK
jgi:hypothetical protein